MRQKFIPTLEGERVAQRYYMSREPDKAPDDLNALGRRLATYYHGIGMDPARTYRKSLAGVWRAASAPIIYGIEEELAAMVRWRQEQGLPLVAPDIPQHINVDRIYRQHGDYRGRHLDFCTPWAG